MSPDSERLSMDPISMDHALKSYSVIPVTRGSSVFRNKVKKVRNHVTGMSFGETFIYFKDTSSSESDIWRHYGNYPTIRFQFF